MGYYPILVNLTGRDCLVVGGGEVATEKVEALLRAGAAVTVIAPIVTEKIRTWSEQGLLRWLPRSCRPEDVQGRFLVIAATHDPTLHQQLYTLVDSQNRLFNAVDDPERCNFITPAVAQNGPIIIAVSTSGFSPLIAQQLRDQIRQHILNDAVAAVTQFLGEQRELVKAQLNGYQKRRQFWEQVMASPIPELVGQGRMEEAFQLFSRLLEQAKGAENDDG